jgi:hypothetical protein
MAPFFFFFFLRLRESQSPASVPDKSRAGQSEHEVATSSYLTAVRVGASVSGGHGDLGRRGSRMKRTRKQTAVKAAEEKLQDLSAGKQKKRWSSSGPCQGFSQNISPSNP